MKMFLAYYKVNNRKYFYNNSRFKCIGKWLIIWSKLHIKREIMLKNCPLHTISSQSIVGDYFEPAVVVSDQLILSRSCVLMCVHAHCISDAGRAASVQAGRGGGSLCAVTRAPRSAGDAQPTERSRGRELLRLGEGSRGMGHAQHKERFSN